MFPLGTVVFPGSVYTLRVFEPRYLELVNYCIENQESFGVCLISRGHEVGGGDERYDFGTLSKIKHVSKIGNEQLAISCIGERRFRVLEWQEDSPYPSADVEIKEVEDSQSISREQINMLRVVASNTAKTIAQMTGLSPKMLPAIRSEMIEEIYNIAEHSYLGSYDRYKVLSSESLEARFNCLERHLQEIDEMYTIELNLRNGPS